PRRLADLRRLHLAAGEQTPQLGRVAGRRRARAAAAARRGRRDRARGRGHAPSWNVDFWVHDADGTVARAAELGGRAVAGPFDVPGFRAAVLADPPGAVFSISELV